MKIIDIVLILLIAVAFVAVLVHIKRSKGRCAYCSHADTCPFKKISEKKKVD